MEYILIFISAIFVNNIVLSQFLGICPFLGVSKKVETAIGYVGSGGIRVDHRYHRYIPDSEVCVRCFRSGLFADYYLYPGDCRIGADGGNYSEKSIAFSVSGFGRVLAFDYYQLLYSWCGYPCDSERLRLADRCCVRVFYGHRFRSGADTFAGLREQMSLVNVPKGMQGTPIALITAGLLAMAFMGFSGVVKI